MNNVNKKSFKIYMFFVEILDNTEKHKERVLHIISPLENNPSVVFPYNFFYESFNELANWTDELRCLVVYSLI